MITLNKMACKRATFYTPQSPSSDTEFMRPDDVYIWGHLFSVSERLCGRPSWQPYFAEVRRIIISVSDENICLDLIEAN